MQIEEKSFLLLLYILSLTFARKKRKTLCYMARIKREILAYQSRSRTPLCTRSQFLFCKKDAFQNVSLSEKKIDTAFLHGFSKCQPTREPV